MKTIFRSGDFMQSGSKMAKFPDWDIKPKSKLFNPRIKPTSAKSEKIIDTNNEGQDKFIRPIVLSTESEFNPTEYPQLDAEINKIKNILSGFSCSQSATVIINYVKTHSIKKEHLDTCPDIVRLITNGEIPTREIEFLYKTKKDDTTWLSKFEVYFNNILST